MRRTKCLLVILILLGIMALPTSLIRKADADGQVSDPLATVQMIWNSTMYTNDVAVSGNGLNVAAVNSSGLFYFLWNSSTPKWWYSASESQLISVVLSADANYAVVGDSTGHIYTSMTLCQGLASSHLQHGKVST
jgi:hypothetical protein